MNISNLQQYEQKDEDNYITTGNGTKHDKSDVVITDIMLEKEFCISDDSTPNYILGYN